MEAATFELLVPPPADGAPQVAAPVEPDHSAPVLRAVVPGSAAPAPDPVHTGPGGGAREAPAAVGDPTAFRFEPLERLGEDGSSPGHGASRSRPRSPAEVLADAHAEAERLREEARAEGFAAGRAAGLRSAEDELRPAASALHEALAAVSRQGDELAATLEREAVELALVLAEKVVAGAIAERPERVLDVVRGALRGLVERRWISVLVHPDDADLVRERLDELVHGLGGVEHCEVRAERRVARGGALIRTPDGELDVRLDQQLRRAAEVLREGPG